MLFWIALAFATPPNVGADLADVEAVEAHVSHRALREHIVDSDLPVTGNAETDEALADVAETGRSAKRKSAVLAYRSLYESAPTQEAADAAIVGIARVYIAIGRDANALQYYEVLGSRAIRKEVAAEIAATRWMLDENPKALNTLRKQAARGSTLAQKAVAYIDGLR